MTKGRALGAVLMGVWMAGCAEAPERIEATGQAIKGGADDTVHTAVFGIVAMPPSSAGELCTGTLIAPDLILTARHCTGDVVKGSSSGCGTATGDVTGADTTGASWAPEVFSVWNAQNFMDPAATILKVKKVINLEADGGVLCGEDVSLLQLAAPVVGVEIIAPRLDLAPIKGETFTAVGYGLDGSKADSQGYRRSLTGPVVTQLGPVDVGALRRATDHDWIASKGPCGGDSGSPALDVSGRSIGVMSRGNATVCTSMIYTKVDPFADWLRKVATETSAEAGVAPPAWVTRPADGSAAFGDACSTPTQCATGLVCAPFVDGFHCTTTDCSACPAGAVCGESLGKPACIVAPVVVPDAGAPTAAGSGSSSSGGSSSSSGAAGGAAGTPDPAGNQDGGCALSAAPTGAEGGKLVWIAAALGLSVLRRRKGARASARP